jgi:hypothetical protein
VRRQKGENKKKQSMKWRKDPNFLEATALWLTYWSAIDTESLPIPLETFPSSPLFPHTPPPSPTVKEKCYSSSMPTPSTAMQVFTFFLSPAWRFG